MTGIEKIAITENQFDSKYLGRKIGYVSLLKEQLKVPSIEELTRMGRSQHFDMLFFSSHYKLSWELSPIAELCFLSGTKSNLQTKFTNHLQRYQVLPCVKEDLQDAQQLVAECLDNRYSLDNHLPREKSVQHKIALLASAVENNPQLSVKIVNQLGEIVALHSAKIEDNVYDLYEIMVRSDYRNGFIALDMIATNLMRIDQIKPDIRKVQTRIYSHNLTSIKLFNQLGLKADEKQSYFYHIWCN